MMLRLILCDYSDAYIFVKGTIIVPKTATADAEANNDNEKVTIKNCALFAHCISEINNARLDNAKDIDVVMPMFNFNRMW